MSEVAQYYKGKSVLVTGATGFMGKVLLSKLLRCCPDLDQIYVLIRTKRGLDPSTRLSNLLDAPIFNELSEEVKRKVVLLEGDVTQPGLGISAKDMDSIVSDVNIIFHSAATVKFDEDLTLSVRMNVQGTLAALDVASKIKDLRAFVHVSTAYCNPQVRELEEKVYDKDMPFSPKEIIALVNEKGDALNEKPMTKKIMSGWPNSYTFTKAIAEKAILEYSHILPIAIMRPSIVGASWKDPIPGWIDNLNGPTGVLVGASTGILQSMHINVNCVADVVPVDICINLLTVIPYFLAKGNSLVNNNNDSDESPGAGSIVPVFNCTTGTLNPINWGIIEALCHKYAKEYPSQKRFWYITGSFKSIKLNDRICQILFHHFPAIIGDGVLFMLGYKPILRSIIRRMTAAFPSLEYFACKTWTFSNIELENIYRSLSKEDQAIFGFNVKEIVWDEFFRNYVLGARHFVLKEDPSTLDESRIKLQRFRILHITLKILAWFAIFQIVSYLVLNLYEGIFKS